MPKRRPSVVIFPTNQPWDPASNLRAWLVAPELEKLGWRVVVVPEPLSLAQRKRVLDFERPDVVFIQQTRNVLNEPRFYAPYPCVLDADDADYLDTRSQVHERIVRAATDAKAVVGGSRFVASCLANHNANAHVLWTSTPKRDVAWRVAPEEREPIIAWAHASPLAYHREAEFVQRVMIAVSSRTRATFWLFGTTESAAQPWFAPIRDASGVCVAIPPLEYSAYLERVAEAAVGLQPVDTTNEFSRGKSFGKLLAYLAGEVAVVASNAVDHPRFFRDGETGMLPAHDVDAWATAIVTLLTDRELRGRIARAAHAKFSARLTSDVFAKLLDPILRRAAGVEDLGNGAAALLDATKLTACGGPL